MCVGPMSELSERGDYEVVLSESATTRSKTIHRLHRLVDNNLWMAFDHRLFWTVLSKIQSDMVFKTSGDMVSSILSYSEIRPVWAVWNRWLSLGNALTVTSAFPPAFKPASIKSRFSFQGACR